MLGPFVVIFTLGVILAAAATLLTAPLLQDSRDAVLFLSLVLAGDVVVVFLAGRWILRRSVVAPLDRLAADARSIASGDYRRRLSDMDVHELEDLSRSLNAMADRLIEDQHLLAENIQSLDRTNRELVEARDELIRSARMASVGTLAAGLAHEIGNPLGAILAYLDAARHRVGDQPDTVEVLEGARGEARRIDAIVRSLLEYSRPSAAELGTFDAWDVLEGVHELLQAQGKLDRVDVVWPERSEAILLPGDPQHLEQILVNLLLNAMDALSERPEPHIVISAEVQESMTPSYWFRRESDPPGVNYSHRRRLMPAQPGSEPASLTEAKRVLALSVRDNGPGIPPEHLESVFDPFFTTKDPGKGTGLGLAICSRLADGLGGSLTVSNHPGGGANFLLRLPVPSV
jgi:two-component system NtrC family sensor kinase